MNAGAAGVAGFIGVGMMGFPMASRLHHNGYRLTVHDAAPSAAAKFCAEHPGATPAPDLRAFSAAPVVVLMLPDSDVVDSVVLGANGQSGLIDVLAAGATVIDMGSSQPLRSQELAQRLSQRGLAFLDAPVSGGVKRAIDGSLAIMVGGDEPVLQRHHALLSALGKTVTHVGAAGAGHAMKALNNYVSAAGLVATAEALHVGKQFGLDPAVMTDVLNNSTGKNNTTEHKVKQFMLSGAFNSGFSLQLMAKDLGIAMALGATLGSDMKLGRQVLELWSMGAQQLGKSADHTEMYRFLGELENRA